MVCVGVLCVFCVCGCAVCMCYVWCMWCVCVCGVCGMCGVYVVCVCELCVLCVCVGGSVCACVYAPVHTYHGAMRQVLHFLDSDLFMVIRETKEVRSVHRPSENSQCFSWNLFLRCKFRLHLTITFVLLRRLHNRSPPAQDT